MKCIHQMIFDWFFIYVSKSESKCVSLRTFMFVLGKLHNLNIQAIFLVNRFTFVCFGLLFIHNPDRMSKQQIWKQRERENESVESYINLMDVCTTKHHNQFCSKWKRSLTETHKYQYTLSRSIYVRISLQLSTVLDLLLCCCHLTWKFIIDFRFLISLLCEETGLRVNDHRQTRQ